ncbi:MAG: 50S ribosomal protein L29 [Candidatus Liptonbacteria bacterium]|nr:50S ribosomal protein L29 [Candidatus Liptonbacteria bacterium]
MKRDAFTQLKSKKREELLADCVAAREKLRTLKQRALSGTLKNVRDIRATRRHIARLLTLIAGHTHETR